MKKNLHLFIFSAFFLVITLNVNAQISNNCANAVQVCNNQLSEQLDDGFGTQECPTGGCGCMLAGEKNTRWFKIVVATGGTLEFTIRPYNGTADYDFSVWNQGTTVAAPYNGACPSGPRLGSPDRCNFAAPASPTGIVGTTNGNSNGASGNLFSNNMTVTAGQVIYIMIDNYDGTQEGFYLDFFGGAAGSGTGTTATFSCSGVNQCTSCNDADCKSYYFASPDDYSFDETAANGACHSNFAYASVKTATVCGTFTVPAPFTTVQFPTNRGYEVTTTNGANTTTCLNSALITYQVWDVCTNAPLTAVSPGVYSGLNNVTSYKVCKTITVTGADCWLSRVCLPYWTMVQNDVVCSATPLTVNAAAVSGTNAGASSDLDAGCTGYQDVYYSFVAPASGRVQVNVIPNATSDVKVSVLGPMAGLDGGVNDCNLSCSAISESSVTAGCNDEAGTGGAERLFAFVIPGQTYYVWISGTLFRPTATFTVQVTETITGTAVPTPGPDIIGSPDVIPSNDQCANATNLNLCVAQTGTNIGATAECTDPDPQYVDAITLENDVWYKWTAPANNGNSEVTLTVTGVSCTAGVDGSTGIQFGIFRGTCASLTPISQGTTSITFTPVAGQTYYFVIDGNAGAQCNFTIQVKRPYVSSQSCSSGSYCAGSSLSASMGITYYGSNPGTKWAYCKSSTFGSACTIDLDNPATYSIYNPAQGLPNPGCTPATYTFVGYILADNGQTTFSAPYSSYPLPQPATASCVRQTTACTFNIYPDIRNTVTVTKTNCSQVVTLNGTCTPAAPVTLTGNTNQTIASPPGGSGTFTPVTVTWNAPYGASAPTQCSTYTIQNTYNCLGPSGANTCPGPVLSVGSPGTAVTSNNNVIYDVNDDFDPTFDWTCTDNYGYGVWFNFVAPTSGNVNINLTSVGVGDDFYATAFLFNSRLASDNGDVLFGCDNYLSLDDDPFESDICAVCADMADICQKSDQLISCGKASAANTNLTLQPRNLNPGETYYIMVDGYENATMAQLNGNFTIQVNDAGGGPIRPSNDNCINAIDLSNIGCNPQPANNINATSLCSNDLPLTGASTENSVWYTYTPTFTGTHIVKYQYANGYNCHDGAQPGVQFGLYTSSDNTCNGTFTPLPNSEISTGTVNGADTVYLVAGQKYYIFIDGYAGNQCTFEFQITNPKTCCTADLGASEGGPNITLCYGDQATIGVTANPIDFGVNAGANPVIGWQFSPTQPTIINPFDPANSSLDYFPGQIDTTTAGSTTNFYRDWKGNYPSSSPYYTTADGSTLNNNVNISAFPTGSTFNTATDTITACVYLYMEYFSDLDLYLRAPDGTLYTLMNDMCTSNAGFLDVCFSNKAASSISTMSCPSAANNNTVTGTYLPIGNWASLNGEGLNGTWSLVVTDDAGGDYTYFEGFNLEIKKAVIQKASPNIGVHHGDYTILNNDPFKYGPQVFWLTPVTFVNYNGSAFTPDSCYSYGTPVKVTLLEKVTTPLINPTCAAPGDGTNGISLTVTSPTGGMPGLPPSPVNTTLNFSNTTALAIPDNNTTWSNRDITVSGFTGGATLTSNTNITVCLTFNPEHTWASDIRAQLIAPNGGILQLTPGTGSNSRDLNGQYCFTGSAATLLENGTATSGNIDNGNYLWSGNYANINGTVLNGLWRLQIADDASGDMGTLASWSITLTSTTTPPSTEAYSVTGTGAASGIVFPSPPVQESETSNSFNVADGQAWSVKFRDNNGCESEIGGTYNQPNLGALQIDTNVCDGATVAFSTSNPIPLFSQYRVLLDFDSYPQDVSWFIYDGNNQVVASGGGYGTTVGAATYTTPATINPNNGPYRFVLYDGFDDGFGSGGGSTSSGGLSTLNFIRVVEIHADGTVDTLFSQNYAFCTPIYCVGPTASVFGQLDIPLGTPDGTFSTGVAVTLENNRTCTGTTVAGAITMNQDGTGIVNTNAAGVNAGSSYSVQYQYTDQYGCVKQICGPLDVFPNITLAPTVNCATSPPTVSVNATCTGCNATYVAEYSYNGTTSWTTSTTGNFQDLYIFAHVKNVSTGVIGCEVQSTKLGTCATVLPIEFIYAKAEPVNNEYIKVSWATASEYNSERFDIWRSEDGVNFAKVGTISASGNSTQQRNYSYDDYRVQKGITYYYKIIEVDMDSREQHSNVVNAKLTIDALEITGIYPNPVKESATIEVQAKEKDNLQMIVYNDLGQIMLQQEVELKAGTNSITVDMKTWANGIYYFNLKNDHIKPVIKKVLKKD